MHEGASQRFLLAGRQFRTRWTNSKACSLPCLKSLRFFSLGTQKGYCLCYRSRRRPQLTTKNTEWKWDVRTGPGIFLSVRQSLFRCATYCVKLKLDCLRAVFHLQKTATRKPCFRISVFIKQLFNILCRRPLSTGLAIHFFLPCLQQHTIYIYFIS